jgi:6-phosphogluconolactonase
MTVQSFVYESADAASAACARKVLELLEHAPAASLYAADIRNFFELPAAGLSGGAPIPQFDVIHRGLGPDAHTASLFPGEPLIDDRKNLAAAVYVEKFHQWRVTLLPGVLEAARHTLTLAAGADKAEPLRSVLHEPYDPKKYPAQIATYDRAGAIWFLDKAAAGAAVRS